MEKSKDTEFINDFKNLIKDRKKISPLSLQLYLNNLHILNNKKPIHNLDFLNNTSKIMQIIDKYKSVHTRKTLFATITSMVNVYLHDPIKSQLSEDRWKELLEFYKGKMYESNHQLEALPENVKNPKQKKNWINWEEILEIHKNLGLTALELKDETPPLTFSQFKDLLKFMVLSLYVLTPTARNKDYYLMDYVRPNNKTDAIKLPKDKNYYDAKNKRFIINNHKTKASEGQIITPVSDELQHVINYYVFFHPYNNHDQFPLLINYNGEQFNYNTITRILNTIFKRNISSTMLRHIHQTYVEGDHLKELKKTAHAMGHSVDRTLKYVLYDSEKEAQGLTDNNGNKK